MEVKMEITDITHDDLVNLLSTALYGSYWLGYSYDSPTYYALENADENDCVEDKMAKLLLHGDTIEISDNYAESEEDLYGDLRAWWDKENECMVYPISLLDIKKGIEKACNEGNANSRECVMNLVDEENVEFDNPQAEEIMQWIMFGDSVYG